MTENTEIGQVKFFDHKKGFGFIEVIKPGTKWCGKDIFFHFSDIECDSSFKKVIPGEVVSFNVAKKPGDDTKDICKNIKAVYNGKLLVDNEDHVYNYRKKRTDNDHDGHSHNQGSKYSGKHDDKTNDSEDEPENVAEDVDKQQ